MTVTPATLTEKQQETVDFYQDYNVPAQWFVGEQRPETGEVEVIALGDKFCWSFIIEPNGEYASSEARLGEFSTGVEI